MQKQNGARVSLEGEQDFPRFLKKVRKEENVYLEQLAEGLMTASQLARIEKGQRPVPKHMRDRLLGRLGVASDLYENLLNIEDHAAWECQRDILRAVEQRETRRAWKQILAYENQAPVNDKIKQQFCLMMEAEVLKQQNIDWCDIAACYEKAAKCTIPDIEDMCIEKKLLSIQEINIVLEYEYYHKDEHFADHCMDLMTFVKNAVYDDLSRVKVYPKIAYYYLREVLSGQAEQVQVNLDEKLQICSQAIELLRDTGRAFFLTELLEIRIQILECMGEAPAENDTLRSEYQESKALADLLKKLCEEYGISAYMQDCTYLYQQRWVFYIGDVLRIRRKMFGFTQKELCQGICSVRTLRRAEKKEANMQHEYLDALLRRLGLSKEFQRARLVTNDREVLQLRKEIVICRNNRDFGRCRKLLGQMREKISLEIPENRQYVIELEASLDWMEKRITNEEMAVRIDEALQCTLKRSKLYCVNELYLTEMEMSCMRKKIQVLDGAQRREQINFWLRFFNLYDTELESPGCIVMYEYVMLFVASELGNMEEYQVAIDLDRKVLKEALNCGRVWMIGNILYDMMWNEREQKVKSGQSVSKTKMTECLKQSLLLSHFCKQKYNEKFYYDKLGQS